MRVSLLSAGALLLQQACYVQAKAVFAHFMVGNTPTWELSDWKNNIQLAVDAHIDAFALNMANGWYANDASLALAFEAAAILDFQLFFSFDYAGNGSWPQADVIRLIKQYGSSAAYFQYQGGPFVSTFEGPGNADDWVEIKAQTGCFFVPDWSSLGAIPAAAAAGGVADGLFSWAGWPWGDQNMTTFVDASYMQTLNASGKPYMMPVSPWFYTNMPGYDKNWLWRGDDTWYQRWQQVWYLQPEFVEIISWNDFGESHYIGPLDDSSFDAFNVGRAPFNYAKDMPHDGWRDLLPFMIDTYKNERGLVTDERLVVWYRTSLAGDCSNGNTTGNTASQLQLEFAPEDVAQDRLFFTALLSNHADVKVMVDADIQDAEWDFLPPGNQGPGGPGLYHGSIPLTHLERVEVIITRNDVDIFSVFGGKDVSADNCVDGLTNWNAWVASGSGGNLPQHVYPHFDLSLQTCVSGYSVDAFTDLCEFTCAWGYCPIGACVCTNMGVILDQMNQTHAVGYPANGDANYAGLCNFACSAGYCPSDYCSPEVQPSYIPTSSPFDPPTCTGGNSDNGNFVGLCSYACNFGFCPRNSCSCNSKGPLIQPPAQTSSNGISLVGPDSDLCKFACTRGYCPNGACAQVVAKYPDGSCNKSQRDAIEEEMLFAIAMATYTEQHLQTGVYYDTFFAEEVRSQADFAKNAASVYKQVARILSGQESSFDLKLTCDDSSSWCGDGSYMAHMSDKEQRINFCNAFFGSSKLESTEYRKYECSDYSPYDPDINDFLRTPSSIILHETTHTSAAMWYGKPALDYAYGFDHCIQLAKGTFDRACAPYWLKKPKNPLCSPDDDPKAEGVCKAKFTANNADTYAHVAAGVWFTEQCPHPVKLPSVLPTGTKGDSCPPAGDPFVPDTDENFAVEGYVHFGDSFAAGMGTGTTSTDSCRVGSNNYGRLLYQWFDDETIPFETLACSGDTTTGLLGQIDKWNAPAVPTVGTLTIGGNDLDFSNLVYYCVITPNEFWSASGNRQSCLEYEGKARALMEDSSDAGLTAKLTNAYLKILTKSGRTDFDLYVTGYPGFFNYDTADCDKTTFHYWWPGYDRSYWNTSPWILARLVLLKQDLRSELDGLVDQLNGVIQQAVNNANAQHGGAQVHYVNVQPYFDTHRWCENADASYHEPDPTIKSTWFFLSEWPDIMLETDTITPAEAEAAELAAFMSQGPIVLPDPHTCTSSLGTDPDPYAVAMCRVSVEVAYNSTGLQATRLAKANADIASGNFSSQEVSWYLPREQIKTFHPRSPGMLAYRNAIIDAM